MKTITLDYSEYEEMVKIMKIQHDTIEELKKQSNIVLVDERYDYGIRNRDWYNGRIPKVVSDTNRAKEMMKNEFDQLFDELMKYYEELYILKQNFKQIKQKKVRWWQI
jgi:hypothetical protein